MQKDILNEFDETGLDPLKTVVRCESQHEADIFLDYLNTKGVWNQTDIRELKRRWIEHDSSTCYHLSQQRWARAGYYEEMHPEIVIVDFRDIYKPEPEVDISQILSFDDFIMTIE